MYLKRRGVLALASTAAVAGTLGCALADWDPIQRYPALAREIFRPAVAHDRPPPGRRDFRSGVRQVPSRPCGASDDQPSGAIRAVTASSTAIITDPQLDFA